MVADAPKLDRPAMVEVAQPSQVDCLFVDAPVPPQFADLAESSGVQCIVAAE